MLPEHGPDSRDLIEIPASTEGVRRIASANSEGIDTNPRKVYPAGDLGVGTLGALHVLTNRIEESVSIPGFQEVCDVLMLVNQGIRPGVRDLQIPDAHY